MRYGAFGFQVIGQWSGQVLGVILVVGVLSVQPASAGPTLGMVADATSGVVTVFNADTNTILGSVAVPNPVNTMGDCAITVDKRTGYVTNFNSQIFQIDLTQSPPALRSGVNPIPISNLGEDVSLSPRGEYLLACDGSANQPVSVILTQKRLQIGTFNLGSDCDSVDACWNSGSTNSSVIVSSFNSNNVRRLRLDSSGKLVDTGDILAGGQPVNTNCVPQGTAGVALHFSPSEIQSFTIPGLAAVDTRVPSVGNPVSGAFNPAGTVFYVQTEDVGTGSGVVEAFSFNPTTGALGAAPLFPAIPITKNLTSPSLNFFGMEQIAVNPAGTRLYVSVAGALNIYNATTGAFITSITSTNIVNPTGVCLR